MLEIPGYEIFEVLHQGRSYVIYRGMKREDKQQSVIIKAPATPTAQADKLRREFEIRQRITSEYVVNYLELKPDTNYRYILIEEDDLADALIDHIPKTGFAPLAFLNIAIPLAEGLRDIHHSQVIHKDIKSNNIIFQPDSGTVKYIDFSSASLLRQYQQPTAILALTTEASLAYISPEQTGRINRIIDYRTDFYSLGVTFYQLVCGRLPFAVKNVSELVHCHLAKQPLAPHEAKPGIPKPVSDIIMKLLQKDADSRYQSAYGLWLDLKRCREEFIQKGEIAPFVLAEHDIPEYFYIPQKLYGRESELSLLTQACYRANQGRVEIVMIAGPAGTGKSVLVQEIQPIITTKQGWFLVGKFELLNRNVAYSAITQALQDWINQVLASSEGEILTLKSQLLAALGNQGQVLIDVMPDLERIIGKQPLQPILDPEQTKNRFHWVFQRFIAVLAQPTHPLIIFLDDWQWADTASLTLLETVMTNPETQNLLLIGAYRNNEVDASHPALVTLAVLQKAGVTLQTITLLPLSVVAVNQWVAETLHRPLEITLPLTTLIYQKTEGVPFFIKAFLQVLYEQGLLTRVEENWQWDLEKIRRLPATENVIVFMTFKIQQLLPATQDTLRFASCLYYRFTLATLQLITQKSSEALRLELQPLLETGLLLQTDDHFQFAHDRIREAAYQQMPEEKRVVTHLIIGRLLQATLPTQPTLEQAFEVTDHLNQGKLLITDPHEQLALAKLNLETAQKAKTAAAYTTALNYLHAGESYLTVIGTDVAWQEHYPLAYDLYKALAEVEYLNGHFDASENYMELILKYAKTVLEKVEIYNLYIIQKTVMAHHQEVIEISYLALRLLGIDLQTQDLQKLLEKESKQVKEILKDKTMQMLLDAPVMTRTNTRAIMKLFHNITTSFYASNSPLHALIITMAVNLTLQYGNTEESAFIYAHYGILLISRSNEISLGYDFGLLAIQLSDKFHHLSSQCQSNFLQATGLHSWRKPLREAKIYFDRAQQTGLEAGELQFLGYTLQVKAIHFFYEGLPLTDIEQELHKLLRLPYTRTNQLILGVTHALQLVILNLKGQTSQETVFQNAVKTDEDYQADWQQEKSFLILAYYLILKAQALYLHGQFVKALEVLLSAESYLASISGCIDIAAHNFYHSLVLAGLYPTADTDTQHKYLQQLEINQAQMKIWADNCPENFLHKYLLVAAEMADIANDRWEAEEKYDQAIQLAQQQGFIQEQALANELAAKFWLAQNKPSYARGLLQAAYQSYERWGAKHKLDQLMLQHGELLKPLATARLSDFNISEKEETISANSLRLLDLTSVLKTSQAISSEVDLAKLLVKIMHLLIENAGAQKGAFLLEESGNLFVQAEYTLGGRIETLKQLPLFQWEEGAHSIIDYVKRTQQPVLLGNAGTDKQFSQDPYIKVHHLQSVLCIPVIRYKQLKGILYVENNLAPYIFTEQHLQILTILASQIAISLENATFYESIRAVTERLNLALQSANVGTGSWDIQTGKIIWDQFMCNLYGIKPEDFGQTYESARALIHPEDVAQVEQAIKQAAEENTLYNIEYRIIKFDDKSIHVMATQGKVYRDDKGQAQRMLGVVWDITERKRLEEERLQALAQAEEKERHRAEDAEKYRKDMEDFINMVCHEIRNPMSGIYGNVDFLKQTIAFLKTTIPIQPRLTESLQKLEESTEVIEQCVKHQKAIIDDVLDISKLEGGKLALTAQPFHLKTMIEEVAKIFTAAIAHKKLQLMLVLPESDPRIIGDANRLKMTLVNLVANALKFTEQGYIKINLQLLDVTPTHTTFALSVEDTGIGMTAEEQTQLFQRFARVAAAQYEGSGLAWIFHEVTLFSKLVFQKDFRLLKTDFLREII